MYNVLKPATILLALNVLVMACIKATAVSLCSHCFFCTHTGSNIGGVTHSKVTLT
jgi:hypothetical protein